MSVLTVSDFRTYFLDRVFTDVLNKKISYEEAVRITNESGVFISTRNEAQTILNRIENVQAPVQVPVQNTPSTYADLISFTPQKAAPSRTQITQNYNLESSSAVSRIMVDAINRRMEITYRGNNRTYGYVPADSADINSIYDAVSGYLESPGTYVHTLRSTRVILPE